jgi:CBS domain-containing protein
VSGRPAGRPLLRFVIPRYVQDDAALARVMGERGSDRMLGELAGKKVRELLADRAEADLAIARPDDTVLELAVLMARTHSPVVAVVEHDRLIGCVTLPRLLDVLLAPR